jgi:hypothetical protein
MWDGLFRLYNQLEFCNFFSEAGPWLQEAASRLIFRELDAGFEKS